MMLASPIYTLISLLS